KMAAPCAASRSTALETRRHVPLLCSASSPVARPSNRTIGTSAVHRTDATTSSPTSTQRKREPFLNRPGTSVRDSTFTSPRTPCGARMTPMTRSSLLIDLEVDLCSIARRHHFQERADGLRDTAATSDDFADVGFRDLEMELGEVAVLRLGDDHRRRIVAERPGDVLEHPAHAPVRDRLGARPLAAHLTDAGTSPSGIPLRTSSERAVAVGFAPFLNQWRAPAAFTTRVPC